MYSIAIPTGNTQEFLQAIGENEMLQRMPITGLEITLVPTERKAKVEVFSEKEKIGELSPPYFTTIKYLIHASLLTLETPMRETSTQKYFTSYYFQEILKLTDKETGKRLDIKPGSARTYTCRFKQDLSTIEKRTAHLQHDQKAIELLQQGIPLDYVLQLKPTNVLKKEELQAFTTIFKVMYRVFVRKEKRYTFAQDDIIPHFTHFYIISIACD